jgi:hypothetical protein
LEPTTLVPLNGRFGRPHDADLARTFDGTEASDVVHFVLLEEKLDATGEAV